MAKDKGYSREGFFGQIKHYDSHGKQIGSSWPGLFGGYTDYDASGKKIGHSEEKLFGLGYNHYDNRGRKTGSSEEGLFGDYRHYDAAGHCTGSSGRSIFDIRSDEEIFATGSLYGSSYYCGDSPDDTGWEDSDTDSASYQDEGPTFLGGDFISAEDMHTLYDAGYSRFDLELMDGKELAEAMEDAGVDTFFYDLDE